eukprot:gene1762-2679_t
MNGIDDANQEFGEEIVSMALSEGPENVDRPQVGESTTDASNSSEDDGASASLGGFAAMAEALMIDVQTCPNCGNRVSSTIFESHVSVWCSKVESS